MKVKYPTKDEILAKNIKFPPKLTIRVKKWKLKYYKDWNSKDIWEKTEGLNDLKTILDNIFINYTYIETDDRDYYDEDNHCIHLKANLSIISFLHEYGHSLFGESELKACRWSIHFFKKFFPQSYKQLQWKGHLLVKK